MCQMIERSCKIGDGIHRFRLFVLIKALPESMGSLAEALGAARPYVKEQLKSEEKRREVFRRLLAVGLEKGEAPGQQEIERLVREAKEAEKLV